jgi:hypothetical protein
MTQVAQMHVTLTAEVKDALKGLDDISKKVTNVGKNLTSVGKDMSMFVTGPIVAMAGGMFALATKTGEYADRILDLTAITGLSAEAIQEWQYVSKIAGVETEAVTGAVEGLVRRLPQLEKEGGRSTEQLAKLGLTFADLNKMKPDDMIKTLIDRMSELEDPLERNAIGASLFGGSWKDIAPILAIGADGLEDIRKEANDMGAVMNTDALEGANNFRIQVERLKTEFGVLFREIALKVMPILMDNFIPFIRNTVVPILMRFGDMLGRLIGWFGNLSPQMQRTIGIIIALVAAIGPVMVAIGGLITAIGFLISPMGLVVVAITAVIAIGVALWQNWDTIKEKSGELWQSVVGSFGRMWDGIKEWFGKMWDGIKDFIDNKLLKPFQDINLFQIGKDIIAGLFRGLMEAWEGIKSAVANIGQAIADALSGKTIASTSPYTDYNFGTGMRAPMASQTTSAPITFNQTITATTPLSPQQVARQTQVALRGFALEYR